MWQRIQEVASCAATKLFVGSVITVVVIISVIVVIIVVIVIIIVVVITVVVIVVIIVVIAIKYGRCVYAASNSCARVSFNSSCWLRTTNNNNQQ